MIDHILTFILTSFTVIAKSITVIAVIVVASFRSVHMEFRTVLLVAVLLCSGIAAQSGGDGETEKVTHYVDTDDEEGEEPEVVSITQPPPLAIPSSSVAGLSTVQSGASEAFNAQSEQPKDKKRKSYLATKKSLLPESGARLTLAETPARRFSRLASRSRRRTPHLRASDPTSTHGRVGTEPQQYLCGRTADQPAGRLWR